MDCFTSRFWSSVSTSSYAVLVALLSDMVTSIASIYRQVLHRVQSLIGIRSTEHAKRTSPSGGVGTQGKAAPQALVSVLRGVIVDTVGFRAVTTFKRETRLSRRFLVITVSPEELATAGVKEADGSIRNPPASEGGWLRYPVRSSIPVCRPAWPPGPQFRPRCREAMSVP